VRSSQAALSSWFLPASEPVEERPHLFLHAGQAYAAREPGLLVHTIVGSCVSVCLWDRRGGCGGVNHYLLAQAPGGRRVDRPLTYGNLAIPALFDKMAALGSRLEDLEAKVFGGAYLAHEPGHRPLGALNVELAVRRLADRGVSIVAQDVGGHRGRKLIFDPHDGSAWLKLL
jgi:chemotaxis protein CheD